jgi:hypothetical protein
MDPKTAPSRRLAPAIAERLEDYDFVTKPSIASDETASQAQHIVDNRV